MGLILNFQYIHPLVFRTGQILIIEMNQATMLMRGPKQDMPISLNLNPIQDLKVYHQVFGIKRSKILPT